MGIRNDTEIILTPNELSESMTAWRDAMAGTVGDLSGIQWVRDYTKGIDTRLENLFAHLSEEFVRETGRAPRVALIALGGYGRGELCLYSDLDLLFLIAENDGEENDLIVKPCLYALWNTKWLIGPATRTLAQCAECFGEDWKSSVSMVEHRLIAGDTNAYREFCAVIERRLSESGANWLLDRLFKEWLKRRGEGGGSVYIQEPNLKESLGGLRDIHFLRWMEAIIYRRADGEGLITAGIISRSDFKRLSKAHSFILNLRTALQRLRRKKIDKLDFESQIDISRQLNYIKTEESLPEEKMLRDYFQHARNVFQLSQKAAHALARRTERLHLLGFEDAPPVILNDHFRLQGDLLSLNRQTFVKVQNRADLILEFFSLALKENYRIDVDSKEMIRSAMDYLTRYLKDNPQLGNVFYQMFSSRKGLARILREMHECAFLDLFLPEFEKTTGMVRLDFFHKFTVDEHLLRSVDHLEQLWSGDHSADAAFVRKAAGRIRRWDVLNLALLIHDVGKGEGRGHVLRGGQIALRIAHRLGLNDHDTQTLHFLVLNHQKLSHLARRRDPNSKVIVENLAREIKESARLNLLLVMTYCDMCAVDTNIWNDWVAKLMEQLYLNTLLALGAAGEAPLKRGLKRTYYIKTIRNYLQKMGVPLVNIRLFLENMPPRYLASTAPEDMPYHIELLADLNKNGPLVWRLRNRPGSSFSEITVVTDDRPGVFATLCGAFSSKGINIHSAQIHSTRDGRALDIFYASTHDGRALPDNFQMERLRQDVLGVIRGEKDVRLIPTAFLSPTRQLYYADRLAMREIKVKFDNKTSETHTVVEVKCPDCPWVLHTLAAVITQERLNIDQAFITTESYLVVDVFYLTDWENNKLDDERFMQKLRGRLVEALEELIKTYAEVTK